MEKGYTIWLMSRSFKLVFTKSLNNGIISKTIYTVLFFFVVKTIFKKVFQQKKTALYIHDIIYIYISYFKESLSFTDWVNVVI